MTKDSLLRQSSPIARTCVVCAPRDCLSLALCLSRKSVAIEKYLSRQQSGEKSIATEFLCRARAQGVSHA